MHKTKHEDYERFDQIFETYKNRIYGYALTIVKDSYAAEDITQEIFIKLWLSRQLLRRVKNMDGYLFKIARNNSLNHLRKAAYDNKLLRKLQQEMVPAAGNDAEEKILMTEYQHLFRDALHKLSPQQRAVYKLSRVEGLNHEKIAIRLKLSKHTVKNHLVAALKRIHYQLRRSDADVFMLLFFLLYS